MTTPGFDPAMDAVVVEDGERLSGMATVDRRERDGRLVSHMMAIWVRPDRRREGIGTTLLEWAEARSRSAGAAMTDRLEWPHVIGGWGDLQVAGHAELAARHGYRPYRHGFEMLRRVADPVGDHPLPEGLEVRPVEPSQHRAIWDADVEAFLDHPEPATRTEEDFQGWFSAPYLDTTLYRVAWSGEEVAGSVLTSINPEENERLGVTRAWLDHISVRRPFRKRGLAAALIAATIRELQQRGVAEAALGVDAANPTGALRLYERLGFERRKAAVGYRKTLEL
jgi:mycothiol synthase